MVEYFFSVRDGPDQDAFFAIEMADVKCFYAHTKQNLLFFAAARTSTLGGAESMCRRLVERKIDFKMKDSALQTPLFYAAAKGNTGCCRYFIEELGMDVTERIRKTFVKIWVFWQYIDDTHLLGKLLWILNDTRTFTT